MATIYLDHCTPMDDMSLEEMQAAFGSEGEDWFGQISETLANTARKARTALTQSIFRNSSDS